MSKAILGQEAIVGRYGLGRVTNLDDPQYIGVTPYVAGYQMKFAMGNVELIPIKRPGIPSNVASAMRILDEVLESQNILPATMRQRLGAARSLLRDSMS